MTYLEMRFDDNHDWSTRGIRSASTLLSSFRRCRGQSRGERAIWATLMTDFEQTLSQIDAGDPAASDRLLVLVYDELRSLAAAKLANEAAGQTLQPTALVHEAYLRLVGNQGNPQWDGKRHFFAAAAEAMRRILIERARRKATLKHGGASRRVEFDDQFVAQEEQSSELIALDEAMAELERHDDQAAQIVKLRYFCGLSLADAALALQVSPRTADRLWAVAKAWIYDRLTAEK